ncbi:HK97-gp10 family putative phage morphogenesis protein [Ligilactobacillus salivarius]|uniref:HK97-gp10 family putative phage morphogenesis protein n=1 Tax=Ligilactobacillus salivarius TaxID=1624 RepID=UPI0002D56AD8|nr:HK97-gp10 family putative phage morphogenesis protein [Ligilactobacillus salivarius]MBM6708459.1 HK97 gp10 family phage protein [Ligilactobacillus salivarius]MYZ01855.1 phage head-tail adapter protein [Ligilactobacillus salivarius]MYZ22876.1 phage head-tail adapter protein [Ligilactobacillus salivarius]UIP51741.1 HK97 gp10 family phage protein [Ligilactobacillus salivarius]WGC79891.1 HK97 gp10 family phage protein [Ligilactobacillus salivarius]
MDDFINQLQNYSDNLDSLVPSIEQKQRITQAGAKVLEKNLQEVTPVSKLNRKKDKYLKEYVMSQNTNIDGQEDGSSTVGFGKKAYIARFLNDGTVKMPATHFVDNAVNESKTEVLLANKAEYDKIVRGGE